MSRQNSTVKFVLKYLYKIFQVEYTDWTEPKKKLTGGQIAGIVIGCIAFIAGIVAIIFACKGLFIILFFLKAYNQDVERNPEMNRDKLGERNGSSDILQDVSQRTVGKDENLRLISTKRLNPIAMTKFLKTPNR